jgi:hypothetical protein
MPNRPSNTTQKIISNYTNYAPPRNASKDLSQPSNTNEKQQILDIKNNKNLRKY